MDKLPEELGRYQNNGTFSFTKDAGNIDPKIIQLIENHKFNEIDKIYWRNSNIDFSSVSTVLNSLNAISSKKFFYS